MHFPKNLTKVDKLSLPDHNHLVENDQCWFLGEYRANGRFGYSDTNQLIINLKKPVSQAPQQLSKRRQAHICAMSQMGTERIKNPLRQNRFDD